MKTINKKTIVLMAGIIIFLLPFSAHGQQDALVSRYLFNGMQLNPAYAGSHNYSTYGAFFRKQWVGFDGAPVTSFAWADIPLPEQQMGLGLNLGYDKIGLTQRTEVNLNYSYHLQTTNTTHLSFGVRANMSFFKSSLAEAYVVDDNDPNFTNMSTRLIPNFGAGAYYYGENYFVGFSVPSILSYDTDDFFSTDNGNYPKLVRHYYLNGGYVFNLNEDCDLKPTVLVRYVKNAPVQGDLNLQFYYKKVFSIGASYRTGDGLVFMAELLSVPKWRFGYAYDLALSKMRKYNFGSHEIMAAYDLIKADSKKSFRFF